jgi:hypothetical protein
VVTIRGVAFAAFFFFVAFSLRVFLFELWRVALLRLGQLRDDLGGFQDFKNKMRFIRW